MAERSSPTGSAFVEPSRTFPERENPHGRGRGCPDAAGGNRGLGGEVRALPTRPHRSVHHPDPHIERSDRRGHTRTGSRVACDARNLTHPSSAPRGARGTAVPFGGLDHLWKSNASKPSTLDATLSAEQVFEVENALREPGERVARVVRG